MFRVYYILVFLLKHATDHGLDKKKTYRDQNRDLNRLPCKFSPHVTFQTILFMSTCYALLGFLERIPTGSALKGFETRCEQLAVEGFAFSEVGSLVRQCFGIDVKRRTRNRR